MKSFQKLILQLGMAVCTVVAFWCPWGFLCSFEGGQEKWRVIYPVAFASAVGLGLAAKRAARRL
ncbi:MAG TPA: hypothetical protein VF306_17240 [Pirellulales bacterium]